MTNQPTPTKPPALLALFWSRLGWRWREDKEPAGFYRLKGNGYMSLEDATAEMEQAGKGEEVPF